MSRRHLAKKISLKLKKGGEGKSKRSIKQTPNRPSRKVLKPSSPATYPVENKDFEFGDIYKQKSEQILLDISNGKNKNNITTDKISHESDLPNTEIASTPTLRKGIKNQTKKNKMTKYKLQPKNKITYGYSPEHGFTDQSLKDKIILLKLHEPKTHNKTRKEKSYETGYTSQ